MRWICHSFRNTITMLCMMALLAGAYAQPPVKVEHFSTEQGLSHDIISSMFKDRQGYLWLGTFNGINRFDGSHITSFNAEKGNIINKRIDQITEDNSNHLWIKSNDGQVYRFNKGTEEFTPLNKVLNLKTRIKIQRILSTENGMLWLNTLSNGILVVPDLKKDQSVYYTFSKSNKSNRSLPSDTVDFFFAQGNATFYVGTPNGLVKLSRTAPGIFKSTALSLDDHRHENFSSVAGKGSAVYFGTNKGTLIIYNSVNGQYEAIRVSDGTINRISPGKNSNELFITTALGELILFQLTSKKFETKWYSAGALFSIFEDRGGDLWLEPLKKGVVRYDRKTGVFATFTQKNDATTVAPLNHFRVFEDRHGTVWSVLRDGGFGYYDRTSKKLQYFYNEPGSIQRYFSNLVTTAFYDNSGVMFLHTDQRGLDKVIFNPNYFKLQLPVDPGVFKSDNEVRGLLADRKSRIWAGARSGLLYVYDKGNKIKLSFTDLPAGGFGAIYSIFQSSDGNVWLGTKEKGLFLAKPVDASETRYRISNFRYNQNDKTSLSSNMVYTVTQDAAGRIWVGTFDKGLNQLQYSDGKYTFRRYELNSDGYPAGFQKIRHLAVDNRGRLWIASTAGLVLAETVNGSTLKFKTYDQKAKGRNGISNSDIQYILKDHKGRMWLATSGGGLNLAIQSSSGDSLAFKIFSNGSGMANDYLLSCIEDRHHKLWLATKGTLSRFDPVNARFDNFNSYDGVPNDGFSEASATLTKDGLIAFGTLRGLLVFDPLHIKYHAVHANLVLTNLQINNEDVVPSSNGSVLTQNIDNTSNITLNHNQNTISIDYSILDFRAADRQIFHYRLIGFDSTWHDNNNRRRATYTNLPPGVYRFEVKSSDRNSYINVPSKQLMITIRPPFWKTWWAYLAYIIILIVISEVARRLVLTFLRLRQDIAVEQKMTDLKMAFFANVSHELRTPLTLILNPADEILKKPGLPEEVKAHASIIQKNASRMVQFVNQLLDLRKSQSGQSTLKLSSAEVTAFVKHVADYFSEEARARKIRLNVHGYAKIITMLDTDKMETVIFNLLSNAFKFSSAGQEISISVKSNESAETIELVVADQGCGVPESDLKRIFQLYHESQDQSTQHLKGTGIGLALSKDFVELHGGEISAANIQPHGLAVTIRMPLKQPQDLSPDIPVEVKRIISADFLEPLPQTAIVGVNDEEAATRKKPLLLLVEDNSDMRSFLKSILKNSYRLKACADGEEGLAAARKFQPDIILSDVMMPKMNGIELLDQLKNDQSTSHIPVILLSAKSAVDSQILGLRYGADHYIGKPFNNELLMVAIASTLAQRKRVAAGISSGKKVVDLSPGQVVVTSKDELFLQKTIAILEEKVCDVDFDIDDVARTLNMSRSAFYVKFKGLTQQPPVEFVRDMRLKIARQHLDGGAGNINEIAYAVGFSAAKYFSTCFKTAYGVSPSEYLKLVKSRKAD